MARDITVTFADGSSHVYRGAPDDITPEQVSQRAAREFRKPVKSLDGGRGGQGAGLADALVKSVQGVSNEAKRLQDRPTSHSLGVLSGAAPFAANAQRVLEYINPLTAAGRIATNKVTGVDTSAAANLKRVREIEANSPYQGSTLGKFGGAVIGSAPTMVLRNPLLQGAVAGAMSTEDPTNIPDLALNTAAGAAAGKAGDLAGRYVVAPVARATNRYVVAPTARAVGRVLRPAADNAIALAERLRIRPTPATIGGPIKQIIQTGLGSTPGGFGPVSRGVEREVGDLANVARNVADELGPVGTPESSGLALSRGARAFERATSRKGGAMYDARDELMGGENAPVLLGSASRVIQDFQQQFPNTPVLSSMLEHPVVRRIASALPEGKVPQVTVKEATEALSHVRSAVRNAQNSRTITGPIKQRVSIFEQAIEDDIMRAAQASDEIAGRAGPGSAAGTQRAADAFWANRSRILGGPLKKAADSFDNPEAVSPQAVFRQMETNMQREGGNFSALRRAWGALPSGARRSFAATHLNELGRATSGAQDAKGAEWSFNTFLSNYDDLAPEARRLVYGDAASQIDDIARYATLLRRTDRLRNYSNTARTYIAGAYLAALGNQIWQGDVSGTGGTLAALPAAALGGRAFMATPAGRLWMRKALVAMTRAGTAGAERELGGLTEKLPVLAAANPELRMEATALYDTLRKAINDNMTSRLAADPEEQRKGSQ